ncbi:MAG: hypothetical protein LBV03_06510 [Fusobacteriales bacterium]|nr:hypothetical protein [Fusobacteriales bacterium]
MTKGAPSYELTEKDKADMADMGLSLMVTGHPAGVLGGAFLLLPKGLDYLYGAASDFRKGDIEGGIVNSAGFISLVTVTSVVAYNSSGNIVKNNKNTGTKTVENSSKTDIKSEKAIEYTEGAIKNALKDAELQTQQGKISLPKVERLGEAMQKGKYIPPIKIDKGIIVDGNHRYVASKLTGIKVETIDWLGGKPERIISWENLIVDPADWGY